ncbi:MAG: hypothetical protein IPJ31_08590 [Bacteroidetes bacterium]|nr:hypothetical protein [Bacteroidota bacterium]
MVSAINRIRTNEKCFSSIAAQTNGAWAAADWQLRQMELNTGTHLFEHASVTNVPVSDPNNFNDANAAVNISRNGSESQNIIDWAFSSNVIKNRIRLGNYNIPNIFNNNNLLANFATLEKELVDIYGFDYAGIPNYYQNNSSLETKEIENQLSLNTCQGCHGSNNKTIFTQVRPATYGQPAKYWTTIPDVAPASDGFFDNRFTGPFYNTYTTALGSQLGNGGITFDNFLNNGVKNAYLSNVASGPFQMVSPFLTGRRYSGGNNWEDDELDNNNVLANPLNSDNILGFKDQDLKGLFFVNDPHNNNLSAGQIDGDYPKLHDQKWGFNDLERRKKDLCIY